MLEVVTVFAPRDEYPHWREYLPLLDLQRRTVEKFGHRHVVVSDRPLDGLDVLQVDLPDSLMHLQIAGQIAYLEQWSGKDPLVFVDADCLIARPLRQAFGGNLFDLGLTSRPDHVSAQVNNGAMYIRTKGPALKFFRAYQTSGSREPLNSLSALTLCKNRRVPARGRSCPFCVIARQSR